MVYGSIRIETDGLKVSKKKARWFNRLMEKNSFAARDFSGFRLEKCCRKCDEMCFNKEELCHGYFPEPEVFAYILSRIIDEGEIIIAFNDNDDILGLWGYKVTPNEVTHLQWGYSEMGRVEIPDDETMSEWVDERELEDIARE